VIVISKEENRQEWIDRIHEQQGSGLTQGKWCEANAVNIHNFKYWKSRINELDNNRESTGQFVAIKPVVTQTSSVRITIGPAIVEVNDAVNLDLLNDVMKVLMNYA